MKEYEKELIDLNYIKAARFELSRLKKAFSADVLNFHDIVMAISEMGVIASDAHKQCLVMTEPQMCHFYVSDNLVVVLNETIKILEENFRRCE